SRRAARGPVPGGGFSDAGAGARPAAGATGPRRRGAPARGPGTVLPLQRLRGGGLRQPLPPRRGPAAAAPLHQLPRVLCYAAVGSDRVRADAGRRIMDDVAARLERARHRHVGIVPPQPGHGLYAETGFLRGPMEDDGSLIFIASFCLIWAVILWFIWGD